MSYFTYKTVKENLSSRSLLGFYLSECSTLVENCHRCSHKMTGQLKTLLKLPAVRLAFSAYSVRKIYHVDVIQFNS